MRNIVPVVPDTDLKEKLKEAILLLKENGIDVLEMSDTLAEEAFELTRTDSDPEFKEEYDKISAIYNRIVEVLAIGDQDEQA